jgi:hypothetical protein
MKAVISGTLGVYFLLGAFAQAQPVHNPPNSLIPEPRFKLEALRFKAINETGYDWPGLGSDEVYVTIHVPTHKVATRSQIFGDVDAGVTKYFPLEQSCILPIAGLSGPTTLYGYPAGMANKIPGVPDTWSCSEAGAPGPFSFTVVFREKDPCDFGIPILACFSHGVAPGSEPPPIDETDDLIGRRVVIYSMQELQALQVGEVLEESIWLTPSCLNGENNECGQSGTDAEYQFTWRITRLPDAQVPVVSAVRPIIR